MKVYLYILVMAGVSYAIRAVPMTVLRKPIKSLAAAWLGADLFKTAVACCAVVFILEFFVH